MDNQKPKKRICVVDTAFSLLYYLLIFGVNDDDVFIMSDYIPQSIRDNIPHIFFPRIRLYPYDNLNHIVKDLWAFIRLPYEILKLRIKLYSLTKGYDVKAYGHGHLLFSFPVYEYPNSVIIEDGIGNYANLPEFEGYSTIPRVILSKIFGKYVRVFYDGFGTHPNIKEIYLTKDEGYSKLIEDKVIVKPLDELMKSIDEENKLKILKIFNGDQIIAENIKSDDILLLTEPFTECLELTLEEELEIYREMISKYDSKQIVIKPHPGEVKDYKKYFPNIRVITEKFPLELFDLIGIRFKKILTIHSSAALNFKDVEVEFYNGELNNEHVNEQRKQIQKQYQEL